MTASPVFASRGYCPVLSISLLVSTGTVSVSAVVPTLSEGAVSASLVSFFPPQAPRHSTALISTARPARYALSLLFSMLSASLF